MAEIATAFGITGQRVCWLCRYSAYLIVVIIMWVSMIPLTPYGRPRWGLHCQMPHLGGTLNIKTPAIPP